MKYFDFGIKLETEKKNDVDIGIKPNTKSFNTKKEYNKLFKPKKKSKARNIKTFQNNKLQNCTTIVKYRTPNKILSSEEAKKSHLANLKYIQKEGKGLDGKKAILYGSESVDEYIKNMNESSWRIILSPDRNDVDLTTMTFEFINKLEELTGYKFHWQAANHYDRRHYHTHILINGIDKNNRKVQFLPKDMVSYMMRQISREAVTRQVGYKTEEQIQIENEKKTEQLYFTTIDSELTEKIKNNELDLSYVNKPNAYIISKRIDFLISKGFAEFSKEKRKIIFKQNWEEELKKIGKYNTYLDGYKYCNVEPDNYFLYEINKADNNKIEGTVIKKYTLSDSNNFAVILKNENKSYYVPLNFYPDCKVGEYVEIRKTKNQRINITKR